VLPVPLNDVALAIVKRHMKGKFPKDHLFINLSTKRPYTQWFISNLWKTHSGTDVTSYEATRHSFCSNIRTDRRTAQRLMRHRDQRSTDNYFHAYMEDLVDAVQTMDNVIPLKNNNENITNSRD
jgi:site-specific recombinase XerD